ncbi:alpha-1,2-mannosyltransferase [Strigomonas culicis]|uniref:GDP-Man:Man(3)GlcNAc(2)-PP-Dol alpha-1,2-mannosyltransferase n=1 Tax=Strigomonas culicis TaxID=28005 RepID=S9TTR6_9TRYP|nr:alpha-1,2-mannosyltransferase [Strigomonas culicis]EPY22298.1 alpha-1,2-mannosyltransferase [Strigomonas culicis]EPY25524.1 alpha-1,2-mannosyltransferase [Strigomonas culicis]|eukprot:EPY19954.1 alpha-1,2-mannosyltransferase [Strigomonas culicis]
MSFPFISLLLHFLSPSPFNSYTFFPPLRKMFISLIFVLLFLAIWCRINRYTYNAQTVGFLHHAAAVGGGGERVLWVMIDQLQRNDASKGITREYVLFINSDSSTNNGLAQLVERQFKIKLIKPLRLVFLRPSLTKWLSGDEYPCLTLFLQTVFGGALLFIDCAVLNRMTPVVIETVGIPMVYWLLRVFVGTTVVSYTHYPIISSTMLSRVSNAQVSTTNHGVAVTNPIVRKIKYVYYYIFYYLYKVMGQFPVIVFANSSWTLGHLKKIFAPRDVRLLYPPCDVKGFFTESLPIAERKPLIVSVGQFRPEKNHMLQLRAFHRCLHDLPSDATLVLMGGVRNDADRARVEQLRGEAERLGLAQRVRFEVNTPFDNVRHLLNTGLVGLHTMTDEHFGIVIVEYLAAGCIVLAHKSGGVQLDIVNDPSLGFLANTEELYAQQMVRIFSLWKSDIAALQSIQQKGAAHAKTFSDEAFGARLAHELSSVLKS